MEASSQHTDNSGDASSNGGGGKMMELIDIQLAAPQAVKVAGPFHDVSNHGSGGGGGGGAATPAPLAAESPAYQSIHNHGDGGGIDGGGGGVSADVLTLPIATLVDRERASGTGSGGSGSAVGGNPSLHTSGVGGVGATTARRSPSATPFAGGATDDEDVPPRCASDKYAPRVLAVMLIASLLAVGVLAWQVWTHSSVHSYDPNTAVRNQPEAVKNAETIGNALMASVNTTTDPCTDFYQYACGNWLGGASIPVDKLSYSKTFSSISESNMGMLHGLMDENWPLVGSLYRSCMNEEAVERVQLSTFQPILDKILQLNNVSDLFELSGEVLAETGVNLFWSTGVVVDIKQPNQYMINIGEAGTKLPAKSYYRDPALMRSYADHVARMLWMLGPEITADFEAASSHGVELIEMERKIAEFSMSADKARSPEAQYNQVDPKLLFPTAQNWAEFSAGLKFNATKIDRINVESPQFMSSLVSMLYETPIPTLRMHMVWSALHALAGYLSKPFRDEAFHFWNVKLRGQLQAPPRWQQCTNMVAQSLPDLVGRYYVQRAFTPSSKVVSLQMIDGVKKAWRTAIEGATWMDEPTRAAALAKLGEVVDKIGYPANWTDYSELYLHTDKLLENALHLAEFSWKTTRERLFKPVSKDYWAMSADTVNAYYDPSLNSINFPAGIIQPPFFSALAPAAINFGGIGSVMGHEIGHGFDDQGRQFDGMGRMVQWWTNHSIKAFLERASCLIDQYSNVRVNDDGSIVWDAKATSGGKAIRTVTSDSNRTNFGKSLPPSAIDLKINGRMTLGENIADNGGVRSAFRAYKEHEKLFGPDTLLSDVVGLSNDRIFFVSYAQSWCQLQRTDYTKLLVHSDPHAPNQARVNLPLSNFPPFAEAYACAPDTPMNPSRRCNNLW